MSHIALLVPELLVGGAQRVMLLLSRELVARGHRVDLVLIQARGSLLGAIPQGVNTIALTKGRCRLHALLIIPVAMVRLAAWLRKARPDVLLSTITGANLLAVLARAVSCTGTRLVLREAVSLDNVKNTCRLFAMRFLYAQANAVIALSAEMAAQIQSRLSVDADRMFCISNPVDTIAIRRCALEELDHPWLSQSLSPTLITVGRLIPQKDHATLIRAFSLLPKALSARLIIVGDGPERHALEELAGELGVADYILFTGFDSNPWRWMGRSQVFILSSRWEGCPNALLEARALGLAVVSTEYDTSVHTILDTGSGVPNRVVEAARPELLAAAIIDVLKIERGTQQWCPESVGNPQAVAAYESVLVGKSCSGQGK